MAARRSSRPSPLTPRFSRPGPELARERLRARWRAEGWYGGLTLGQLAAQAARRTPATQLRFLSAERPSTLRLDELYIRSRAVAGGLAAAGVGPGDRVAVQIPNWAEAAISYVAVSLLGAVIIPVVHLYGPAETNWILDDAQPTAYLGVSRWGDLDHAERAPSMPALAGMPCYLVGPRPPAGALPWAELALGAPLDTEGGVEADGAAVVIYTSGTSGVPKCVVHSHNSIIAELRTHPSPPPRAAGSVALQPWPAGHIGGLTALLGPLVHGIDTVLVDRWDTGEVFEAIRRGGVTAMSAVPTMLHRLLDELDRTGAALPLRDVITGGAGVPPSLVERADAAGWRVARCYGSSEHPSATASDSDDPLARRAGTDGRPRPGTEVRVVGDDGAALAAGEAGEVQLIGPEQFLGYASLEHNDAAFTDDGWLRTGDIGILDDQGFLTITDRVADVIVRGGEKISSMELEDVILRHPSVADVAVVAVPDEVYGERACAVVVPRDGRSLDLEELRRHFRAAGYGRQKVPERLVTVTELPRTPSGKVRKTDLRQEVRQVRKS